MARVGAEALAILTSDQLQHALLAIDSIELLQKRGSSSSWLPTRTPWKPFLREKPATRAWDPFEREIILLVIPQHRPLDKRQETREQEEQDKRPDGEADGGHPQDSQPL